jgi:hypothetical protein
VTRVLPTWAVAEIRQLDIVSDGPGGTLGMVHRSSVVGDQWILSIDVAEPRDVLESTLIHELAHMLTLDRADLSAGTAASPCDGARLEIGCAHAGSALADWSARFWPDPGKPASFDPARFVSQYATTGPHEDLAESFLAYVLGTRPEPHPSSRTRPRSSTVARSSSMPGARSG